MAQSRALSDALAAAEQASKAKTSFLSSMSHEIRTPMNAIIGLNAIALNAPELTDKTRDYLEKIGSSANHLLSLINDILDMSRIESGKTVLKNEDFSFSKLLEQINTIFGAQCADKGLDYNCRIKGTTFIVTVTLMDSAYSESDPEDHDMNLGELSVLVIDDDPVACEHAKLVLGKAGIACETVLSGKEAIVMPGTTFLPVGQTAGYCHRHDSRYAYHARYRQ